MARGDRRGFFVPESRSRRPGHRRFLEFPASPRRPVKAVVVGYDRRFLSDQFGRRVAEIFAGNGFSVVLSDCPVPTPSVSFAVKQRKAAGGVMITASHNPPIFNGYKLKAHYGGSAESAFCQEVEKRIDQNPVRAATEDAGIADPKICAPPISRRSRNWLIST